MLTPFVRRAQPPHEANQAAKESISEGKYPRRGLEKYELMQPVLNERAAIGFLTCLESQLVFPDGQRANDSHPGLKNDNYDRSQVDNAKVEISDPVPFQGQSGEDKQQANNHKTNEQNVKHQNCVGSEQIKGRVSYRHLVHVSFGAAEKSQAARDTEFQYNSKYQEARSKYHQDRRQQLVEGQGALSEPAWHSDNGYCVG